MAFEFPLDDSKALGLEVRRRIYSIVNACAGCHFREIQRRCGLATGTVRYHLDYLVRCELIFSEKEGNSLRFFPKGFATENTRLLGLLRQNSIRKIILSLLNGGCTYDMIARASGLSDSTVSWYLKKLESSGIISSARKDRTKRYELLASRDEIIRMLITYRESFLDRLVDNVIDLWDPR